MNDNIWTYILGTTLKTFIKKMKAIREMWVRLLKKTEERRGNKKRTFDSKLDWTNERKCA